MQRSVALGDTVAAVSSPYRRPLAGATSGEARVTDQRERVKAKEKAAEGIQPTEHRIDEPAAEVVPAEWDWQYWPRAAITRLNQWRTTTGAFDTAVCLVYLAFAAWLSH